MTYNYDSRTTRWRLHTLARIASFLSIKISRVATRLAFEGQSPHARSSAGRLAFSAPAARRPTKPRFETGDSPLPSFRHAFGVPRDATHRPRNSIPAPQNFLPQTSPPHPQAHLT